MLTHSTSNYSMQVAATAATSSSPLKLVDVVFTKNLESLAHTLKKCQIPDNTSKIAKNFAKPDQNCHRLFQISPNLTKFAKDVS